PAVDERRPARRMDHDPVAAVEKRLDERPGTLAGLEQLVLALPSGVGVQHAIEVEADGPHRPSMAMPLLAKNMASSSFVSARLRYRPSGVNARRNAARPRKRPRTVSMRSHRSVSTGWTSKRARIASSSLSG